MIEFVKPCHLHRLIAKLLCRCSVFAYKFIMLQFNSGAEISAHTLYCAAVGVEESRTPETMTHTN